MLLLHCTLLACCTLSTLLASLLGEPSLYADDFFRYKETIIRIFGRGEAWTLSPMKYIHDMELNSQCHVLCMIAEQESPEFHKQSQNFYEVCRIS